MINLSEDEIENILNEVQGVLASVTKSEKDKATRLAKAEGDDDGAGEESGGGEASAGGPPEASAPPAPEASGPPAGAAPEASASADPAAAAPGGDPAAAGGPVDPAALQAEYAKLPIDELKAHAEAAMAALQAAMGGAAGGDPAAAGVPPAPPMADAAGAGGPPPMAPAMKKEIKVEGNGGEVMAAKKSEKEIADLKKSLDENQQALSGVIEAFTKFVSKPVRKAETALKTQVAEGSKLSKSDATAKLRAKVKDQSLTKKDRELINGVFFGTIAHDDAAVAHLLA